MAIGGALGVAGVPIPGVEIGIALSALILGVMVVSAARPPLWLAAVVVAGFAIFHGHAHGTELPHAVSPLAYSIGFVLSTGMLHMCGIAFGLLTRWRTGTLLVRAGGAVIALAGAVFLARAI
jgi:urease accessory protein